MGRANTNAKTEFLRAIGNRRVKCADINYNSSSLWGYGDETAPVDREITLKVGHSWTEWELFLKHLDFNYDSGYGNQELFGTVWFDDNETWMTRGEYDGSEWWDIHTIPPIPQELF